MDYKALASSVGNRDGYGTQEWVYRVLRTGIINGTLPGGMQLKQDEISAALNVSHIPVREALRQLEAQSLVTIHPNRGATVTELTREMLINIMQVRAAIQAAMLEIAIPRMTDADFEALDHIIHDQHETKGLMESEVLNKEFHDRLIARAENPFAEMMMEIIHANIDRYLRSGFYSEESARESSAAEHEAIVAACRRRDIPEAVKLLHAHIMDAVVRIPSTIR